MRVMLSDAAAVKVLSRGNLHFSMAFFSYLVYLLAVGV